MPVIFKEKFASRKGTHSYSRPEVTLELYAVGTDDENELLARVNDWLEQTYTVNFVTHFFDRLTYDYKGNNHWDISVHYEAADSDELQVHPGGGTRKVYQSLQTLRAYNCRKTISQTTQVLADAASASADVTRVAVAAFLDLNFLTNAINAANDARTAADVPGVNAQVRIHVINCADFVTQAAFLGAQLITSVQSAMDHIGGVPLPDNPCVVSEIARGDPVQADVEATVVEGFITNATTQGIDIGNATTNAELQAELAQDNAVGGNAQTLDAADAATTAAGFALQIYNELASPGLTVMSRAIEARDDARVAADAATSDLVPGFNDIANHNRAIGVTDKHVEGVDTPDKKFEFSVSRRFTRAAISGNYLKTLYDLLVTVNDKELTIVYNGQTITFAKGEVLFLEFPFKMNSKGEMEITYKFGVQQSILRRQNFTIGSSGPIEKIGWEYLWVKYRERNDTATHSFLRVPESAYVEKVFEFGDFSKLILF